MSLFERSFFVAIASMAFPFYITVGLLKLIASARDADHVWPLQMSTNALDLDIMQLTACAIACTSASIVCFSSQYTS